MPGPFLTILRMDPVGNFELDLFAEYDPGLGEGEWPGFLEEALAFQKARGGGTFVVCMDATRYDPPGA